MATPRKTTTSSTKKTTTKKTTSTKTTAPKKAATPAKKPVAKKTTTKKAPVVKEDTTPKIAEEVSIEPQVELAKLEYPFVCNFEKVSRKTFVDAMMKLFVSEENVDNEEVIKSMNTLYDQIKLPERLGHGTSEYHFWFPIHAMSIPAGVTVSIPTGIKCFLSRNWCLEIIGENFNETLPELGFDLVPPVSIVNADDYIVYGENDEALEGQIYITVTNNNKDGQSIEISHNSPFACGVLRMFGIAYNEHKDA